MDNFQRGIIQGFKLVAAMNTPSQILQPPACVSLSAGKVVERTHDANVDVTWQHKYVALSPKKKKKNRGRYFSIILPLILGKRQFLRQFFHRMSPVIRLYPLFLRHQKKLSHRKNTHYCHCPRIWSTLGVTKCLKNTILNRILTSLLIKK